MNPITGASGAGPDDDDDDQADSGGLQQVQILPGSGLGVAAAVAAVSTAAATSSVVTTSIVLTSSTVLTTSATTSTSSATTSVGKGSSGGRSDKGKGPAPKRCAASGSVISATTVHPDPADASPELSDPTSSVTTAARTCTVYSDFKAILDSVVAAARSCHAVSDVADARASSTAAAAASAHVSVDASIPDADPDPDRTRALACARAMDKCVRDVAARAAAARAAAASADSVVALARAVAADLVAALARSADSRVCITCPNFGIIINSVVASARSYRAVADAAYARANSAAAAAARATADLANLDAAARVGASDTDNDARVRARRARARARDRFCARAADIQDRAAAARAAADSADRVVALARAFAADHIVAQDRAADSLVPSQGPDSDPVSNSGARTAAVAGSSISSLLPNSSLMPPGFVDLFGFAVSLEFSEVVNRLISAVSALAKNIIYHYITRAATDTVRNLSSSERSAWYLTNGKLCEIKFVARCFAEYSYKLLPTFISNLCSVKVWDSSSRSLVPLTGKRLADFWLSLDKAILKSVVVFFMSKWYELIGRFPDASGTVGRSSGLCGEDFVNACASVGTSSSSVSRFYLASEGVRARVASHDGGSSAGDNSVDLFGFEVSPEVEEMVNVLTCEVSALARQTYSRVVAVPVSRALERLSFSEQYAWLITNMMVYKTGFVYKFLLDYCDGLCSEFICSLFRVIPGDASGRSFLPLTGDSLRGFWVSLSVTVMRIVQDIFRTKWGELISQFSVLLGPGEESSSTVLRVGDFISASDKSGVPNLAASGIRVRGAAGRGSVSRVAEVVSGSYVAAGVSVAGGSCSVAAGDNSVVATSVFDIPPPPPPPYLDPPPLFFTAEETGLPVGVVSSEVLVVTEGDVGDVIFVDDYSLVSGELGDRTPLSGEALAIDSAPSTSEMLVLAGEEVEVSEVGLPIVGAAADLGVLEGESSERTVMPTTGASLVTSSSVVEVGGSSTTMPRIGSPALRIGSSAGPVAPKKSFMSRYRAGVTSSSGMSSASMSSSSIVSSGPLSSVPVAMTGSVPPLATTTGTAPVEVDIGERLAALLNRGLPPSPPPASELAPTGGEASSSTRGSGRGGRKRKRKRRS
nr:hypothetical protein [Candidatus Ichthyocystis sparus]